jgi:hypothetical protein
LQEHALFLKRVKYFAAKISRAWADGTLRDKAGRFLISSVATPLDVTTGYLRLARQDRRLDLAVFPHFKIVPLPEQSVDLYHNACSFSEMDSVSAAEYLRVIERTCRRYFSHINHEVRFRYRNPDGSTSVNLIGSELVPDTRTINRVFKKPRIFCLPEDRSLPAFEYLYERRRDLAADSASS